MNPFLWNLVLAVVWAFSVGKVGLTNLAVGFLLGFGVLWIVREIFGSTQYFRRLPMTIGFLLFFIKEVIVSNIRVAYDVLTPTHHMRPGVIAIPLDAQTDLEITLLAMIVTLTPGTLALDVSPDRKTLYLHSLFVRDPDLERAQIKAGYERRLLEVLR